MWRVATFATLSLLSAAPCRAACHTERFNFYYGSDSSTTMLASSGARCTIKLILGRNGSINSIAVTEQGQHGSASYNGSIGYPEIAYQSAPSYKGADAFAFALKGQSKARSGLSTIRVSVDVK
jgi:hypothetical protein